MQKEHAFEVSAHTKRFQSDLAKVVSNNDLSNPPADFIKKYNLREMDNRYYAQGFIQTQETFDGQNLIDLGIKMGRPSGKMQTVSIPLEQFEQFLELPGINYFQLSETVNPKQ